MDNRIICLLDISGFIYRAYYALQHTKYNQNKVGALFGFCLEMLRIRSVFKNAIFVAAMDCSKHTFRNDIYPEYKSNRKSMPEDLLQQLPLIHECCEKFGFNIVKCSNYEADDIIASFVNHYYKTNEIIIISSDKDLLQLLNFSNTQVYNPIKQRYITDSDIIMMFKTTKDKITDILALVGDRSDNIPGAYGIGPQKAAKLLFEYGSLENILKHCNNNTIISQKEIIILSKKLVELKYDLNIDYNIYYKNPNNLDKYLKSFGFDELLGRLKYIV